jgi:hypothetical protein
VIIYEGTVPFNSDTLDGKTKKFSQMNTWASKCIYTVCVDLPQGISLVEQLGDLTDVKFLAK